MDWDWSKIFAKSQHDHAPHVDHSETPWSSGAASNKFHPDKRKARKRQKAARKITQNRRKH